MGHPDELDERIRRRDGAGERLASESVPDDGRDAAGEPVLRPGPDEGANGVAPPQELGDERSSDVARPAGHEDERAFGHLREPTLGLARSLKVVRRETRTFRA